MKKTKKVLKITLDAVNGHHFHFGTEKKNTIKVLKEGNDSVVLSSGTQLLTATLYCEAHNMDYQIFDANGNELKDIQAAMRYTADEFIDLEMFGDSSDPDFQ